MSTRCQIGIYEQGDSPIEKPSVLLYKHSDGYPDGVLPTLQPFCERFRDGRGLEDTEYLAAWLLFEFMETDFKKKYGAKNFHGMEFCGFGICGDRQIHGDIEYFYRVDPDKIAVFEPVGIWEKYSSKDFDKYDAAKSDLRKWTARKTIILKKLAAT